MPSPKPEQEKSQKRRPGRPPEDTRFDPTPEHRGIVELCAGFGIPEDEMVRLVVNPDTKKPISPVTLRKYFRTEIDRGRTSAKFKVIGGLFKNATTQTDVYPGGIPTAQIFWLKTQAGWKEAAPDAPPTEPEVDEHSRLELARRVAFAMVQGARLAKAAPATGTAVALPKKKTPTTA